MVELLGLCCISSPIQSTTNNIVVLRDVRSYRCSCHLYSTCVNQSSLSILDGSCVNMAVESTGNRSLTVNAFNKSLHVSLGSFTVIRSLNFCGSCILYPLRSQFDSAVSQFETFRESSRTDGINIHAICNVSQVECVNATCLVARNCNGIFLWISLRICPVFEIFAAGPHEEACKCDRDI